MSKGRYHAARLAGLVIIPLLSSLLFAQDPVTTGVNQKRQVNIYDPDGTRVEVMEANTTTGKPTPSSTAPPPSHQRQSVRG